MVRLLPVLPTRCSRRSFAGVLILSLALVGALWGAGAMALQPTQSSHAPLQAWSAWLTVLPDLGPRYQASAPQPASHPSGRAYALTVERAGEDWLLTAEGAPRDAAIETLAQHTGARVHGMADLTVQLATGPAPLHLHWRGSNLVQLWGLVLGQQVNHVLHCQAQSCEMWLMPPPAVAMGPEAAVASPLQAEPVLNAAAREARVIASTDEVTLSEADHVGINGSPAAPGSAP